MMTASGMPIAFRRGRVPSVYALGWIVGEREGLGRFYDNDGSQMGTTTYLVSYPDQSASIAVIVNLYRAPVRDPILPRFTSYP